MKFRLVCLLLSILFLVCCASSPIEPIRRDSIERSIQYHTWTASSENQLLKNDFALYSYVLIKNERSMDHFGENLLLEIIASDHNVIYEDDMQEPHWLCNLFIFPQKDISPIFSMKDIDGDTRTANIIRENYDFDYTKKICNYLIKASDHKKIQKILKEESGPFLVSILKPISIDKLDKDTNILLLNCSNLNNAIIPLVVDRYIKYVEKNEISEDQIIRNLSIFLGDGITDLNDCLFSFMIVLDAIESKT